MIAIIDYGMGNLRSVQKAFEKFCPDVRVTSSAKDILCADKVILPGVGAFRVAMNELKKRGLIGPIRSSIEKGRPFLGVCLGMQILFTESEEGGSVKGLDIIKGRVKKFKKKSGLKVPHMGWNTVKSKKESDIMKGVRGNSYMYFVHSYYAAPKDKAVTLCETDYAGKFTSGVAMGNVYGFQFHPEKSQSAGLRIVENFAKLC
ncbi:MAG: imidazole glycerol phosphate synthase subunit HisH [Candidatus Omnitrophota bacterium]|jgi:glutamine amidotransferase